MMYEVKSIVYWEFPCDVLLSFKFRKEFSVTFEKLYFLLVSMILVWSRFDRFFLFVVLT